jgi:hypothetical protein
MIECRLPYVGTQFHENSTVVSSFIFVATTNTVYVYMSHIHDIACIMLWITKTAKSKYQYNRTTNITKCAMLHIYYPRTDFVFAASSSVSHISVVKHTLHCENFLSPSSVAAP